MEKLIVLLVTACIGICPIFSQNNFETYSNPVADRNFPDPSVIKAEDGSFYIYGTSRLTDIMKSDNLVDWIQVGTAFTPETRPNFENRAGLWAPDINYINGQYVLYYTLSKSMGWQTNGIGVSISDNPEGPFEDLGPILRANEIGVINSIDQFYIEDNGKKYIFWGSLNGIFGIELNADGLSIKKGAEKKQIAGDAFEGTMILKRGKYYYFFGSVGTCCEGITSTYQLAVGRSDSLFGPYVDSKGKSLMLIDGYTVIVSKNERFVGNGHCSEIVQDDEGNDWILYHGYDVTDENPRNRKLLLDQIKWDKKDWPYIEKASPSLNAKRPVFHKK
jgi:arabinan endo-1,5-alpha-L-arabinosidase